MSDENGQTQVVEAEVMSPTAVARREEFAPQTEDERLAHHMVKSGYFKDSRQVSQALVKIIFGRALGLDPVSAMTGIYVSQQGKLCLTANLMAATIKRSRRYDYRVRKLDAKECVVEYYERRDGGWELLGTEVTRAEDFRHISTDTWKKYPKNMLFARNVSNGSKFYCPDAFGGSPVYLPDEMPHSGLEVDGDTMEVLPASPTVREEGERAASEKHAELQAAMTQQGVGDEWLYAAVGTTSPSAEEASRALTMLRTRARAAAKKEGEK